MKKSKKIIIEILFIVTIIGVTFSAINAFASNTNTEQYEVIAFDGTVAKVKCLDNNEVTKIKFADYVNTDYEALDVNNDGTVNCKDYANLQKEFNPQPDIDIGGGF